jgi:hypothetical protein
MITKEGIGNYFENNDACRREMFNNSNPVSKHLKA